MVLLFSMLILVSEPDTDKIKLSVQEICPVSGNKLSIDAGPVKVKVGKEVVFLYSKNQLGEKISPIHWVVIHDNFRKAQKKCPVMGLDLPKKPKWVIVKGQIIYVCCPPCIPKIKKDPD